MAPPERPRRRTVLIIGAALLCAAGLFAAGMYVASRQAFPYSQLRALKHRLDGTPATKGPVDDDAAEEEPDFTDNTVVERRFRRQLPSLMHISDRGSIRATRERLARFIWNAPLKEGWRRRAAIRRRIQGASFRLGVKSSRERDCDAAAAEVDERDQGVGAVEAEGAVAEEPDLAVESLEAAV